MKIVLATGVYAPDIGGPATYVRSLAEELTHEGVEVIVVTYEVRCPRPAVLRPKEPWQVMHVPRTGGPFLRWMRYARALRRVAVDADIVEAFSSVSTGVPLRLARLRTPKKILRLGGDFAWERYTDFGGSMTLREWYASSSVFRHISSVFMGMLLKTFDHIVFSTSFQQTLYGHHNRTLPPHSVIENAHAPRKLSKPLVPLRPRGLTGDKLRLLFLGRFVGFKNLPALVRAMACAEEPDSPLRGRLTLTLVGEGPYERWIRQLIRELRLQDRVKILPPVSAEEREHVFAEHDLLILPSLTEISPHVALEARAAGLLVLLTAETGLSQTLTRGMLLRSLRTPAEILTALKEILANYPALARSAAEPLPPRTFRDVTSDHLKLFHSPLH